MSEIYSQAQLLSLISVNWTKLTTLQQAAAGHHRYANSREPFIPPPRHSLPLQAQHKDFSLKEIKLNSSSSSINKEESKLRLYSTPTAKKIERPELSIATRSIIDRYNRLSAQHLAGVNDYLAKIDGHSDLISFFYHTLEYLSLLDVVDIKLRGADMKPMQFTVKNPTHSECRALEILFMPNTPPTTEFNEEVYQRNVIKKWSILRWGIKSGIISTKHQNVLKEIYYFPYPTCFTNKNMQEPHTFEYTGHRRLSTIYHHKKHIGPFESKVKALIEGGVTASSW
jgi:hypothetical protein